MSAVQWWCSGVMLNTLFGKQGASEYGLYAGSGSYEPASVTPPQSASLETGATIDYTV
jgi:hypothetical protein